MFLCTGLPKYTYYISLYQTVKPFSADPKYKGLEVEKTGYIMVNGENGTPCELPNIIGIVKKK